PQMPRLSAASGVLRAPSCRILSGIPSTSRSATERVASGVTSRSAIPVPPTVTTSRATSLHSMMRAAIWSFSSGTTEAWITRKPAFSRRRTTAGPEVSSRLLWKEESLTVRTAAVFTVSRFEHVFAVAIGFVEQPESLEQQTLRGLGHGLFLAGAL